MPWSSTDIAGKPATLFEPTHRSDDGRQAPVLLFLHDHDGVSPSSSEAWTAEFERHGVRCVSPQGGDGWWIDRPSSSFDERLSPYAHVLENVVPWIGERWNTSPPLVGLIGVGLGGQGVLQIGFRRARRFPVVAAIAPCVDFHEVHGEGTELDTMYPDREAARQETALLHIHPLDWPRHLLLACDRTDPWHESLERLASKLYSSGIPFEEETSITAGGHDWTYYDAVGPRAIEFVVERLEKESRRA